MTDIYRKFDEMVGDLLAARVQEEREGKATPMTANEFDEWIAKTWVECQKKAWEEDKP